MSTNSNRSKYDKEQETKFLSIFREGLNVVSEGFSIYDENDRLVFCNEAYLNIYDETQDLIVPGSTFEEIIRAGAERGQYAEAIGRVDEWVQERLAQHQKADGRAIEQEHQNGRWLLITEHKTPSGCIVGSRIDITALKKAERESTRMLLELERASRWEAVGQLASGIAHEINTPTQYIGDNLHFLEKACDDLRPAMLAISTFLNSGGRQFPADLTPEKIAELDLEFLLDEIPSAIKQAEGGINQVTAIVSAMRDFAFVPRKDKSSVDLPRLIEGAVTISRNEWKYIAEVELDLDPDLEKVDCYQSELSQVILNLIVNAAHALSDAAASGKRSKDEKGKIIITTKRSGDRAEISVRDNGGGIPPEICDKVFLPFFTTKDVGKGSGQGLAISYDIIVNKHKGELLLDSEVGAGSTFIIRIPLEVREALSR